MLSKGFTLSEALTKVKICFMLQASVIYNKSFKSYRTGTYTFMNLQQSPDVTGTIDQSGDYLGVSLTFYFKKKQN